MKEPAPERRVSKRYRHRTPLRVHIWKSPAPEQREESLDLSPHGVYFASATPFRIGETVEIFFTMPEEITTEPNAEWRCTGHVVRVEQARHGSAGTGVGVRFDCYEVARESPGEPAEPARPRSRR